jgi:hypothetical protein
MSRGKQPETICHPEDKQLLVTVPVNGSCNLDGSKVAMYLVGYSVAAFSLAEAPNEGQSDKGTASRLADLVVGLVVAICKRSCSNALEEVCGHPDNVEGLSIFSRSNGF